MSSQLLVATEGVLSTVKGPVFPSIPSPFIELDQFEVTGIRKLQEEDGSWYDCLVDIKVSGEVACRVCDHIPGDSGTISEGIFTHNGSGKADGTFRINGSKSQSSDPSSPFPFSGTFEAEFKDINICEGNNTFQFTIESPIYLVEGYTLWAASFRFPDDPSYYENPKEEDLVTEPSVNREPGCVSSAGPGEFYPFYLAGNGAAENASIGTRQFQQTRFSNETVLSVEGMPAVFVIRPACTKLEKDAPLNEIATLCANPDPDAFLKGFLIGSLANGAELISLADGEVMPLDRTQKTGGFEAPADSGPIQINGGDYNSLSLPEVSLPVVINRIWCAFKSDPPVDDFTSVLIFGRFEDIGIETFKDGDWRALIFGSLTNYLSFFLEEYSDSSDVEVGYVFGRFFGEALRRNLNPDYPVQRQDDGLMALYRDLLEDPFFSPEGYGHCATDLLESCVGAIRDARRWAGRDDEE